MASVEEEEVEAPEHEKSESMDDDDLPSQKSSTKPAIYENVLMDTIIQEDP